MRLVLLGGLRLVILDPADDAISDLRRAYALVTADTARHSLTCLLSDAGIPHRVFDFVRAKLFFPT